MPSLWIFGSLAAALCVVPYVWLDRRKRPQSKYFPGPPAEPILGHLRLFPQDSPWVKFAEWGRQYGGIIHLNVLGKPVILINDAEEAYNLLEKKGSNYSDRPRSIIVGEMTGLNYFLVLTRYGDDFRTLRRYTTQYFNSRDHIALLPVMKGQVKILLKNLLNEPSHFDDHVERYTAGAVVKATYDYDINSNKDSLVRLAADAIVAATSLGMVGLTPVDFLPILRHIPPWLPGASLLRKARDAKIMVDRMIDEPFEQSVDQRKLLGREGACFVDYLVEDYQKFGKIDKHHELLMKNAAAQIYAAGAETSSDTFLTFFLMMVLHPEVQKKAQAEIDRVIGTDHLPTLEDRPDLPYIECVVKEVFRINPSLPLGIPHATIQDDYYKDRFIPAGSMVISNLWGIMRDERYFPEPDKFNPDRFLSKLRPQEKEHVPVLNTFKPDDPSILVFGFGRRACPGRFFADASIWLTVANVLATFEILPPIDPTTGKESIPKFEYVGGATSRPKPFNVRILPRSEKHTRLIQHD